MQSTNQSDVALMMEIQQGNIAAFEMLYNRYFKRLCAFAIKAFSVEHPADIVQDVFMKIIEKPHLYNSQYSFQTWIYTLVGNKCKNEIRKQHFSEPKSTINSGQYDENFPDLIDSKLLKIKVENVLNHLEEKERQIIILKYEHNLKQHEIAQILNIPEGSVKSCLFYTLKKLAPYFKSFEKP
ncbi:MAG: sigma-70 family RNA polymerase sigma factor [Bacteroidia bacterium]|nr:sigma-70 family RNA polymerase sigma factor [Bacteroidia bacterium]